MLTWREVHIPKNCESNGPPISLELGDIIDHLLSNDLDTVRSELNLIQNLLQPLDPLGVLLFFNLQGMLGKVKGKRSRNLARWHKIFWGTILMRSAVNWIWYRISCSHWTPLVYFSSSTCKECWERSKVKGQENWQELIKLLCNNLDTIRSELNLI